MKLDLYLISDIKIYSKWIKDLNIYKTLRRIHSACLCDLGLGNGFLDMTPKPQATR